MRRGGTWVQRWRVPLGFLVAALFIILARPRPLTLAVGGVVAVCGLLVRAWASGHIRKNDALAISGPYAYTRNPLYFGTFILGLGFTVAAAGSWLLFFVLGGIFAALFLGIYLPVMRVEASTLAQLFGEDYRRYASEVPLLFPRLTPYRRSGDDGSDDKGRAPKFDLKLYLRYREYRAALGLLLGWSVLALKAFLVG
ncbi:MAG TPA: isoprenylcysteine carboxylmethyltransferase family protein [Pyrinomonadaceae bacterium]|nr:isoprenylcysteine carboxylmethyltransferase family protein [Pyrinomonadaceae bacterium]